MNWNYFADPDEEGWYPVIICYDPMEGAFPSADYWNGVNWKGQYVVAFGDKQATEDEAKDLAYENDPDERVVK